MTLQVSLAGYLSHLWWKWKWNRKAVKNKVTPPSGGGGKWLRPSRFKSGYGWIRDTVNHVRDEAKDIKKLPQQRREIERKREREGERVIERQNQGIKGRMQYAAITSVSRWAGLAGLAGLAYRKGPINVAEA